MNINLSFEYRDLTTIELEEHLFKLQELSAGKIFFIGKIPIEEVISEIRDSFCLSGDKDCNCARCMKIEKIIKKHSFVNLQRRNLK